ncbi:MAG: HlyD family efflux transporter periplasmic adaptor subunit [Acidobacteriota bacterium]
MMTTKRCIVSLTLLLLVSTFSPVWAHDGVLHDEGLEMHPHLEILTVGPDGRFQVSVAQLPDAPLTGETVQFLIRLEESLAIDDPLLGGHTPFLTDAIRVRVAQENESGFPIEVTPEEAEAGVFRFNHAFSSAGDWTLHFEFDDGSGTPTSGEMLVSLEAQPVYWSMLFFQAVVILAAVGLVVQRFRTTAAGSSVVYAGIVLVLAGVTLFLVDSLWDTGEIGLLEVAALNPTVEEVSEPVETFAGPIEHLQEPRFVSSTRMFSGTVRHATHRITQVRSPLPGIVVFKSGVPQIGDPVQKGQVLGVVEDHFNTHDYSHLLNIRWELQKIIMETSETAAVTEADYQRGASLLDLGVISRREFGSLERIYNTAKTASDKAQAKLRLHDSQLRRNALHETPLVAPISGYISQATYSAGQMIYENDPIFEIVDPSVVWVEVFALPQDLMRIQDQSEVSFRSSALRQTFSGKLVLVRPDAEAESNALRVLYEVKNPERWLKPGMLVDVYPAASTDESQQAQIREVARTGTGN